jgi:hypothetical protein
MDETLMMIAKDGGFEENFLFVDQDISCYIRDHCATHVFHIQEI